MTDDYVRYEKEGNIARITLNRPEKLNAFVLEDGPAVKAAFHAANEDEEVKVVILRGEGRAFCAGYNLNDLGQQYFRDSKKPSQRHRMKIESRGHQLWESIFYCDKVTIGQGHGHILGNGLDWFLACDLLICAEGTRLGSPPFRMIGPTGTACPTVWLLKCGPAIASEMSLMGRFITAEELHRRGVLNKVVPADKLEEEAAEMARQVCQIPADGLAIGKRYFRLAWDLMGAHLSASTAFFAHSLGVQQRLDPGEWNIVQESREKGTKGAAQSRDERFKS